jgi:hypothetical protein
MSEGTSREGGASGTSGVEGALATILTELGAMRLRMDTLEGAGVPQTEGASGGVDSVAHGSPFDDLFADNEDTKDKYKIKADNVPKLKRDGSNYEAWAAQVKLALILHPSKLLPIVLGDMVRPLPRDFPAGTIPSEVAKGQSKWDEKNHAALYFLLSTMEDDRKLKHARETLAPNLWAQLKVYSKTFDFCCHVHGALQAFHHQI